MTRAYMLLLPSLACTLAPTVRLAPLLLVLETKHLFPSFDPCMCHECHDGNGESFDIIEVLMIGLYTVNTLMVHEIGIRQASSQIEHRWTNFQVL